jgi:hypothetical protein
MYVTAFNSTSDPITVDGEGRVVHGGDYGTVDTTFDEVRALLDSGALVQVEVPEGDSDVNPQAAEAAARTGEIAGRAEELGGVDKDVLQQAALDAGVPDAEELDVAALRAALAVRTDVPIPAKPQARRSRAAAAEEE